MSAWLATRRLQQDAAARGESGRGKKKKKAKREKEREERKRPAR
jgi:hypothetical protein